MCRPLFANAKYSPMGLRRVLRPRLEAGEALIGFGSCARAPSGHEKMLGAMLMAVPGVGPMIAGLLAAVRAEGGVIILTDKRLIMLRPNVPAAKLPLKGVVFEAPLEVVRIRARLSPQAAVLLDGESAAQEVRGLARKWRSVSPSPRRPRPPRPPRSPREAARREKQRAARRRHAEQAGLARAAATEFIIEVPGRPASAVLVDPRHGHAARRLWEGLALLARDDVAER